MLSFIARTFLLLAAAFGLGAIGGRLFGRKSRERSILAQEPASSVAGRSAEPMPGLLAEATVPNAIEVDLSAQERPSGAIPVSHPQPLAGIVTSGDGPAAVSTYGGSGVSAAVERVGAGELGSAGVGAGRQDDASTDHAANAAAAIDPRPQGPFAAGEAGAADAGSAVAADHSAGQVPPQAGGPFDPAWDAPQDRSAERSDRDDVPAAFKASGSAAPLQGATDDTGGGAEAIASSHVRSPDDDTAVATGAAPPANDLRAGDARPPSLPAPRGGTPDDLTRISGIGPSIERLLFENGIFHFDQIAAWSAAEARWADGLSGFKGRAEREAWIDQAAALAAETATP